MKAIKDRVHGHVRLGDVAAELVAGLRSTERRRWTLGVYCPPEHVDTVGAAARDVLGLRTAGSTG